MTSEVRRRIQIPDKLVPVFNNEADVRGAYGGRGSAKTMTFAKMTAVRALMWDQMLRKGVIVCGREYLNTIDDSSLAEVRDAIESEPVALAPFFDLGDKYIRTKSGRINYKFAGLDTRTARSLKSKAKVLLLWADEAEPVTDDVWEIVLPTLRQEDSELWVTWNPARKSSATDRRFRQRKNVRMRVEEMNWRDNPWFPQSLNRQRRQWLLDDPESYRHVWEGDYSSAKKGSYFTAQLNLVRAQGRICKIEADPLQRRKLFVDIGGTGAGADAFAMWGAQLYADKVNVLDYYEAQGQDGGFHLAWMRAHGYASTNTDVILPHDGATGDKIYAVSYESFFRAAGYTVITVPNQGAGAARMRIEALRQVFPKLRFNKETTEAGIEALAWYHEKRSEERDIGLGPEHDWSSHGSDAAGLMAIVATDSYAAHRAPQANKRRRNAMAA